MLHHEKLVKFKKSLNRLEDLKKEMELFFTNLENNLDKDFRKINRFSKSIDVTAEVLTIFVNLGKYAVKGVMSLKLSGTALDKANKELAKAVLEDSYKRVGKEITTVTLNQKKEQGVVWAFGKKGWDAFLNIQKPSFWTKKVVGDPKKAYNEAKRNLKRSKQDSTKEIEKKISQLKIIISQIESQKPFEWKGSNFTGKKVIADFGFHEYLNRVDKYAKNRGIKVYVTHSFRKVKQKLAGAVVKPVSRSNHLAGFAIDFNIHFRGKNFGSEKLKKDNLKNLPLEVSGFIQDIRTDKDLRWGGDFGTPDPIHIDVGINLFDKEKWMEKYITYQK